MIRAAALVAAAGLTAAVDASAAATWRVGGRLDVDAALSGRDTQGEARSGEVNLRRARLGLRWRNNNLRGVLLVDAADGRVEVLDAWLRVRTSDVAGFRTAVQMGRRREPLGLDALTGSDGLLLQERAMTMALSPGYSNGLTASAWNRYWTLSLGAFDSSDGERAITARGVRRLDMGDAVDDGMLHLGIAASLRWPNDDRLRFRIPAETAFEGAPRLRSDRLEDVGRYAIVGTELLWLRGPLTMQGEWLRSKTLDGPAAAIADSGYLQASWTFGARPRGYSNGTATRRRLEPESGGAWEIGLRASRARLGADPAQRSEADSLGFALNWTPRPGVRVMSQWLHSTFVEGDQRNSGPAAQVRVQWTY
ncbi:MAG: porin [Silanimonas sp.]